MYVYIFPLTFSVCLKGKQFLEEINEIVLKVPDLKDKVLENISEHEILVF